jgi:hypothetical protein
VERNWWIKITIRLHVIVYLFQKSYLFVLPLCRCKLKLRNISYYFKYLLLCYRGPITVGSWVRIPLEAWMSVCVYTVFVLYVLGSGLATGWSLVQGVLPNVLDLEIEVKRSVSRMPYAPSGSNRNKPTKPMLSGARGSVVGWGTMLQARRSLVPFPMRSLDFFNLPYPSSLTIALGSAQPLTEVNTRNFRWGKGRPVGNADNLTAIYRLSTKCGSLDVLQSYGPPRPVKG